VSEGVLSHEEALRLIARAQQGDEAARDTLVERNLALVGSVARGFLRRGAEYEDLVQIGCIGLLKAVTGYDASYGVRFSTYAVPMIAGEIKRFLRDDGMIKVSRALKENAMRVYRAMEQHKKRTGREASFAELEAQTGLSREEIVHAMEASREPVSLNEPAFSESETTLLDTISSGEGGELIDRLLVQELLGMLSPRERQVVFLRFFEDRTQSEIAGAIGVSQVQVSRILSKTLKKLREQAQ